MQIAAFLSDLKSLSICSHEAAIALVRPATETPPNEIDPVSSSQAEDSQPESQPQSRHRPTTDAQPDPDLQRANELVSLHYDVKMKYLESGLDPELVQAGKEVDEVISALSRL